MNFRLSEIKAYAARLEDYQQGITLCALKQVRDTREVTGEESQPGGMRTSLQRYMDYYGFTQCIAGTVQDKSEYYQVYVFTNQEKEFLFQCDCSTGDKACAHAVALMIDHYQRQTVPAEDPQSKEAPRRPTDMAASKMLGQYALEDTISVIAQNTPQEEKVSLCAALQIHPEALTLSFTIGNRQKYVLKDLEPFAARMKEHSEYSYGKKLTLVHHPICFEQESQPLLSFLLRMLENHSYRYHSAGNIALNETQLDAFMALMLNRKLKISGLTDESQFQVLEADCPPRIQLRRAREGMRFSTEEPHFWGSEHLYIARGNTLYRCSNEMSRALRPLMTTLKPKKSIFIAQEDLGKFCASVLPVLRQYAVLEGDWSKLDAFMPLPLETRLYLDMPKPNRITTEAWLCYGDTRIAMYPPQESSETRRDRKKEAWAKLKVNKYFTNYDAAAHRLYLEGDDKLIYRFLTEGLPELSEVASLYCTQRLEGLKNIQKPKARLGISLQADLLNVKAEFIGMSTQELDEIFASYREQKKYHRLKNGHFLSLEDPSLAEAARYARTAGVTGRALEKGLQLPVYQALYTESFLKNAKIETKVNDRFELLAKDFRNIQSDTTPLPEIHGVLREYQKTGYRWLKVLEKYGLGGILADDMGLGKTLQIICLFAQAYTQGEALPSLVVCPSSVIYNWLDELARFTPALKAVAVTGSAPIRDQIIKKARDYQILVTSYDLLRRDEAKYDGLQFRYEVLDEAQYIKNNSTRNAACVKGISSRYRFALTGTPVENRLSELWSIFDFLMPGYLDTYHHFRERFEKPALLENNQEVLSELMHLCKPYVLRRMKRDVLTELPPKTESILYAQLEGEQKRLYTANLSMVKANVDETLENNTLSTSRIQILAMLTRLRQICCDPRLCYENYTQGSAKTQLCLELIHDALESGHRLLIFSQFTAMLDILQQELDAENIPYFDLRGSTSKEKRVQMVQQFNSGERSVFLISLKAGGTGLNLTGADMVVHFDPWWNLAAENQASDRAYRIGQELPVQVYKLVTEDTIEERILALQNSKKELSNAVLPEGTAGLAALSPEDLINILR